MHLTLLLLVCGIVPLLAEELRISAPDIDPLDGAFNKSVRIKIISNAKASTIHFTVDGSTPTDHSPTYKEPFDLVGRGEFIVRAIAVSDTVGRNQSVECYRKYIIRAVEAHATILPTSQTVRGSVNVSIAALDAAVEYLLDYESQWRPYTGPFVLSAIGQRTVKARIQGTTEPVVQRQYLITPPLVFDVAVNCEGCGSSPSRCRPFTLWIQGAKDRSQLFLTSSSRGCENINHILDGTQIVTLDSRSLGYSFTSSADAGKAWVCIAESGDPTGPFVQMRQRKGDNSFLIADSNAICSANTHPTTPAPPTQVGREDEGISLTNMLLWIVGLGALGWFVKSQRGAAS